MEVGQADVSRLAKGLEGPGGSAVSRGLEQGLEQGVAG